MFNHWSTSNNNRQLILRDSTVSPPIYSSVWEMLNPQLANQDPSNGTLITDDFFALDTAATNGTWSNFKGTGGSVALANKSGGWVNLPTAASSNDYIGLSTQQPIFALKKGVPLAFECALNVTEANTNTASWWCGFTSVLTTGFISNAGVPPSSYSGAVFYKTEGALALNFQTSNSTTQVTSASAIATVVSGQTYLLSAFLDPNDGVTGVVTYFVSTVLSNVRIFVAKGTANLTLASLANMYFACGIKTASTNAETLTVDWAQALGIRYYQ